MHISRCFTASSPPVALYAKITTKRILNTGTLLARKRSRFRGIKLRRSRRNHCRLNRYPSRTDGRTPRRSLKPVRGVGRLPLKPAPVIVSALTCASDYRAAAHGNTGPTITYIHIIAACPTRSSRIINLLRTDRDSIILICLCARRRVLHTRTHAR